MVAIGHVQMKLVQYYSVKGRDTCSKFLKILCRNAPFSRSYGDFLGGLCQYVKSDQTAKRFNESFFLTRDYD